MFLTHYHGDHTGRLGEILPHIPAYMGATAKAIYLNYARRVRSGNLSAIEKNLTFSPTDRISVGDIAVIPLNEAVKPANGLIPIHGEEPERFRELIPDEKIHILRDGEKFTV